MSQHSDKLKALADLREKATPGKWMIPFPGEEAWIYSGGINGIPIADVDIGDDRDDSELQADTDFIVASGNISAAEYREMAAEMERLERQLASEQDRHETLVGKVSELSEQLAAAEQRVKEAEADARRYRWLKDQADYRPLRFGDKEWRIHLHLPFTAVSFDAAVDAAQEQTP